MIAIVQTKDGFVLPVRAQPGARKPGVLGTHAGSLKIAVATPPQGGKANKALLELLRELLTLKRSQIELASGKTSREKRFLIRDLTRAELEAKLSALLPVS